MRIRIEGQQPIRGSYRVSGNSNAAIALIAASMLTDAPITLTNVPDTTSVGVMLEIGSALGLQADSPDLKDGAVTLSAPQITARALSREYTDALGGTLLFAAPILARRRHVRISLDYPLSRINTHLTALRDLGCGLSIEDGVVDVRAEEWDQREIILTQASVTATAIAVMVSAALGKSTTLLNAASEPHVVDLLLLLSQMGVQIEGIGSNLLTVHGGKPLGRAALSVAPDHIEAGSVAAIAALSGGRLTVEGVRRRDMRMIAKVYERLGLHMGLEPDALSIPAHERFEIASREEDVDVSVESSPWPGFPSDLIGMATVIATQARGTVLIHEKLFSNRMLFVDKLNALGAQIVLCDPHRAIVVGPSALQGDYIDNPDVRIGLAMLGAAVCSRGTTLIDTAEAFDRTFDHVLDKLSALGAAIRRVE